MGSPRKAARIKARKDHLIELPDEILSNVVSRLTLKEAVKTSILSRSWRSVWTCHPDLLCDSVMLGNKVYFDSMSCHLGESDRRLRMHQFVENVDHLMYQRQKGLKVDSLAIHFHLGKEFSSHISKWIQLALEKGVENIDVDLSEWRCFESCDLPIPGFERFTFSCTLLVPPNRRFTLKHLRLALCTLDSIPCSWSLTSLKTVELQDVNISDRKLHNLVLSCLCLERMSLHSCNNLVKPEVSHPKSQLKTLSIRDCFRLLSVELDAQNLTTFEYTGELVAFSFKNAPRLANLYLSFTGKSREDGVTSALTRFVHDVPHLETLNLLAVLSMKTLKLPDKALKFKVKKLVLTIFPFQDDDKFDWLIYVLKAFPLLRNLQLNLFSPNYVRKTEMPPRQLPECRHGFITELEVNGFHGNQHEIVLLKYLLDNLAKLESLVVSPRHKVYKGFNCWDFEAPTKWNKLRPEIVEWFHEFVPPTVQLPLL